MRTRKWVRCSLTFLHQQMQTQGYEISQMTISRLLKQQDYTLKSNRKRLTGPPHPDRDRQFRDIQRVKRLFLQAGHPVISVDAKKKELIGDFKNAGQIWCKQPPQVNVHDFQHDALGKATPYGIYDLYHNQGFVVVGTSADTPEFAVDAIVQWWQDPDRPTFANEDKLLILCDAGGSNGYRPRLWKLKLQTALADRFGLEVMGCHFPTGASKWNPIEHRLFSYISTNWAGQPLRCFDTILGFIRDTSTKTGLTVKAVLQPKLYRKGLKVPAKIMPSINLIRRKVCPKWNYLIKPRFLTTNYELIS